MQRSISNLWWNRKTELDIRRRNRKLKAEEVGYISISNSIIRLVKVIGDDSHWGILILWNYPKGAFRVRRIEGYVGCNALASLEKRVY